MSLMDFLKILLSTEGFTGAVVGLIAVILLYAKVPQDIVTSILALVTVIMAAITAWLTAARVRARMS